MSGSHVRRGGAARTKTKGPSKVAVPKRIAKRVPGGQARANRIAGLAFGGFLLAIGLVVLVALDIPAKAERSAEPRLAARGSPSAGTRSWASAR